MYFVGVDLHKHSISVCVMIQEKGERRVVGQRRFACADVPRIKAFFTKLRTFQAVVEATANYEWFVTLIEPMADRVVLAHPKKLRVIAESTKKTDKLDARVLAEFLTLGMIPEAWRPTPRVRAHRALVRYRYYFQQRSTSVKNKLRYILADYNADVRELFTERGREYLTKVDLSNVDRFRVRLLLQELDQHIQRRHRVDCKLQRFAKSAPARERQARQILESIPYVGAVTIDVVLSEVGDFRRFSAQRKTTAYAGLAPGVRQSDGRQGFRHYQRRLAVVALGLDPSGLAIGWPHPSLGVLVRAAQTAVRAEEGHRRRRQTLVVRDGLHAQQRPDVPPVKRSARAAVNRKHKLTISNDNQEKTRTGEERPRFLA